MSHVNASMPSPISGYKIGTISSQENAVITTIQSTTDSSKKYTVTEQASNQPAASLAATAAGTTTSGSTAQVQTVQDQDKTYVLSQDKNKSMAACVKGANTVNVEASDLNVAQLLEAAKNACKSQ
jgi:general stress protein 26